ncbi:hypothetical protein FRB91_000168 [Serendipita sp. 411]|nr:hypothetical protein FRB91_000168 [Serendipita sp. 411]
MQFDVDDGRDWLRQVFRRPPLDEAIATHHLLSDPHVAWEEVEPITGFSSIPPIGILTPPSSAIHARFVVNNNDVYALVSLCGRGTRVPPCPGPTPPSFHLFGCPLFYDGSQGPHEARRYAQELDSTRPWLPFHTIHQELMAEDRPIEHWDAADFWDPKSMQEDDFSGGFWKKDKIRLLLERHTKAEQFLWTNGLLASPANAASLYEAYGPSLPFFDNFTIDQVSLWRSWRDGMPTIGRTLRYVSEVLAMGRWLIEARRQKTSSKSNSSSSNKYMGVWAGSIGSQEDWSFILKAPLPVYGIFLVPPEHPVHATVLQEGKATSFDGDERFRTDAFAASIPFKWVQIDSFTPAGRIHYQKPVLQLRYNHLLPSSYRHFLPPSDGLAPSGDTPRRASHLPWNSYLFEDESIYRSPFTGTDHVEHSKQAAADHWRRMIAVMESHSPPVDEVIHPAMRFIESRDPTTSTTRYFREHNKSIFFWVTPLGPVEASKLCTEWPGYFHQIGPNDVLLSDWPWPNLGDTLPFFEAQHVFSVKGAEWVESVKHHRVYLHDEPGDDRVPTSHLELRPPAIMKDYARLAGPLVRGKPRTYWLRSTNSEMDFTPRILPLDSPVPGNAKYSISRFMANFECPSEPTSSSAASCVEDGTSLGSIDDISSDFMPCRPGVAFDLDSSMSDAETGSLMFDTSDPSEVAFSNGGDLTPQYASIPPPMVPRNINELLALLPDSISEISPANNYENHRVSVDFLLNLAFGRNSRVEPSLSTSFITGPISPDQVLQMIETNRMWEDVWDSRDRARPIDDPYFSSPSSGDFEDMEVCYSAEPMDTHDDDEIVGTWFHNFDDLVEPLEVDSTAETEAGTINLDAATEASMNTDEANTDEVNTGDSAAGQDTDIDTSEQAIESSVVASIREYRARAAAYLDYRFSPIIAPHGHLADQVVAVNYTNPIDKISLVCYPMRIYNVFIPERTPEDMTCAFRQYLLAEDFGDVVLITAHAELDGIATMDVAFRYPEDALSLWTRCGHYFGGHYWKVQPLSCMGCPLTIFPPPPVTRSLEDRRQRLQSAIDREVDISDDYMDDCVYQMLNLLALLMDESRAGDLAIDGVPTGEDENVVRAATFLITSSGDWSQLPDLGPWTRNWSVPPAKPDQKLASSEFKDLEMNGAERNKVYRHSYHMSQRKFKLWKSAGIQLPVVPKKPAVNNDKSNNAVKSNDRPTLSSNFEGFLDLWNWYKKCEGAILMLRHISASGVGQHLNELPVPSTQEERRAAVEFMSFNALEASFSRTELLQDLRSEMLTTISRIIAVSECRRSSHNERSEVL